MDNPPDAGLIQQMMQQILQDPAYGSDGRTLWDVLVDGINWLLEKLNQPTLEGSGVVALVVIFALVAVALLGVALGVWMHRRRGGRVIPQNRALTEADLAGQLARALAGGAFPLAVRLYMSLGLLYLERGGWLQRLDAGTDADYERMLRRSGYPHADQARARMDAFERVYYGGAPVSQADLDLWRRWTDGLAGEVRHAP